MSDGPCTHEGFKAFNGQFFATNPPQYGFICTNCLCVGTEQREEAPEIDWPKYHLATVEKHQKETKLLRSALSAAVLERDNYKAQLAKFFGGTAETAFKKGT